MSVHLCEGACLSSRGRGGLAGSWGPDGRPVCQPQQLCSPAGLLHTSRLSERSCSAAVYQSEAETQKQLLQKFSTTVKSNVILDQNMAYTNIKNRVFRQMWLVMFVLWMIFEKGHRGQVAHYFGYHGSTRIFWWYILEGGQTVGFGAVVYEKQCLRWRWWGNLILFAGRETRLTSQQKFSPELSEMGNSAHMWTQNELALVGRVGNIGRSRQLITFLCLFPPNQWDWQQSLTSFNPNLSPSAKWPDLIFHQFINKSEH